MLPEQHGTEQHPAEGAPHSPADVEARWPKWLRQLRMTYGLRGGVFPVWSLVFRLSIGAESNELEISEECRLILERICQAGIQFQAEFSRDGDEVFIVVGADEATLMEEATFHMLLPLKLRWKDPVTGQVSNDGAAPHTLPLLSPPFWRGIQRALSRSSRCAWRAKRLCTSPLQAATLLGLCCFRLLYLAVLSLAALLTSARVGAGRSMDGTYEFHMQIKQHFVPVNGRVFFGSGMQQRLVMHRIERVTRINMELKLMTSNKSSREEMLTRVKNSTKPIQIFRLKELLECYGCTTGTSELANNVRLRLPKATAQYEKWLEHSQLSMMLAPSEIFSVIQELEARDAASNRKVTSGSFLDMFPVHYDPELDILKEQWGNYSLLGRCCKRCTTRDRSGVRWFVPHWQPLDEIRAYFGDHVALYFAWQGLYTRKLVMPAVLGILTMIGHVYGGVDKNPLTVLYSVFLALWSTLFLESWLRLENELKFQWGSEGFELREKPRTLFKGIIQKHELTGVERLVHKSMLRRALVLAGTNALGLVIIVAVIFGAMNAYLVRELTTPGFTNFNASAYNVSAGEVVPTRSWTESNQDKIFKVGSSVLSLTLILIASRLYKGVARDLTDRENHRTQTEHEDSLIVKNFMFGK
jgi:hypothetical protein